MMEGRPPSSSWVPSSRHERMPSFFFPSASPAATQMPFSAFSSSGGGGRASLLSEAAVATGKEDGDVDVGVSGDNLSSVLQGTRRRTPSELDLDVYECESEEEEGIEVSEEPEKPAPPPRASGSKRSRAAEVHNLSEKRRRSRINEKMKALQNLIPNSNKTDKASMLDEAIEYLKQLQLQVQMLSMRNGLSLHPMYLPSTLQPVPSSSMRMGFNDTSSSFGNMGMVGMLPLSQNSTRNSFELLYHNPSSQQSMAIPRAANLANNIDASRDQHGPFRLPVDSEGLFAECVTAQQQMVAGYNASIKRENEIEITADAIGIQLGADDSLTEGTTAFAADGDNGRFRRPGSSAQL